MRAAFLLFLLLAGCGKTPGPQTAAPNPESKSDQRISVEPAGQKAARIEVVEVRTAPVTTDLEVPGQLTWDEDRTWSIGVVATGKVIAVTAKVGDTVRKGDVLARMHSHDVHDTKASLRQAKTERERALSQWELARRNRERMRRLLELKAIPQVQAEQAEAEVRNAEAAVKRAEADVSRETQHLTEVLEIAANDDEPEGHAPGEFHDDELVPIKASADGTVIERKISSGSVVTLGENAFTVADPESLWLIASFPERALPLLRVGESVRINVQAYPGRDFSGKIVRLGDTLDRETRTLKVRIAVRAQNRLKPEMYAAVRLVRTESRALTIPASAVQEVDGQSTVFVETSAGQFEPRKVIAETSGSETIIRQGLKQGERIAAQGSYLLKGRLVQSSEGQAN